MALLRIDLRLPTDQVGARAVSEAAPSPMALLARDATVLLALVGCLATIGFWSFLDGRAANTAKAMLAKEHAAIRDSIDYAEKIRNMDSVVTVKQSLAAKIAAVERIDQNRYAFAHVMDQVAAALPADAWLDTVATVDQHDLGHLKVKLTGLAPTDDAVAIFLQRLEASPFLHNVLFITSSKTSIAKQSVVHFQFALESEVPDHAFLEQEMLKPDGTVVPVTRVRDMPIGAAPRTAPTVLPQAVAPAPARMPTAGLPRPAMPTPARPATEAP